MTSKDFLKATIAAMLQAETPAGRVQIAVEALKAIDDDGVVLVAVPREIVRRVSLADEALTRAHSTRDRSDAIAAIASYPIEDDIEAADARLALANHVLEQLKVE